MSDRGPRVANDGCAPLICLHEAWRNGWRPPAHVSEELHRELRVKQDPTDPLTAFAGFGCSYSGLWFGGYARGWQYPGTRHQAAFAKGATEPVNYAAVATRSLDRLHSRCASVAFTCQTLEQIHARLREPDALVRPGDLVYCDPPFLGTAGYSYFKGFPYALFLECIEHWIALGANVFVSEYAKQSDNWKLVGEWEGRKNIATSSRVDRLYRVSRGSHD